MCLLRRRRPPDTRRAPCGFASDSSRAGAASVATRRGHSSGRQSVACAERDRDGPMPDRQRSRDSPLRSLPAWPSPLPCPARAAAAGRPAGNRRRFPNRPTPRAPASPLRVCASPTAPRPRLPPTWPPPAATPSTCATRSPRPSVAAQPAQRSPPAQPSPSPWDPASAGEGACEGERAMRRVSIERGK